MEDILMPYYYLLAFLFEFQNLRRNVHCRHWASIVGTN